MKTVLNFDGFGHPDYGRIGVWAERKPADGKWTADPEMPINKAERIAARFKQAGGVLKEIPRGMFGHHPHGLDPNATGPIVDFFRSCGP